MRGRQLAEFLAEHVIARMLREASVQGYTEGFDACVRGAAGMEEIIASCIASFHSYW